MRVVPSNERSMNEGGPRVYQAIFYLTQAANAPMASRVPNLPWLTVGPIDWVPLADLDVPRTLSEIRVAPPDSTVSHAIYIEPAPPPGAPSARSAPAATVSEAPFAPQVIYVRPEAPYPPPVVLLQPIRASVSPRVPTGVS